MKDPATKQNLFTPKIEGGALMREGVIWDHLFDIAKSREDKLAREKAYQE